MSAWYTRPAPSVRPNTTHGKLSPGLLYQKWHAYDGDSLQYKEARPEFLRHVTQAVEAARTGPSGKAYEAWLKRYSDALQGVAGKELVTFEAKTVWRLAVGMATNPALETGISLHPLLGFPYLPGSTVKGLAHHAAEVRLLAQREDWEDWVEGESPPDVPDEESLIELLDGAEIVKALFGSLHLVPRKPDARPRTARSLLEQWVQSERFPRALHPRAKALLKDTGGLLAFYDSVPAADGKNLLQLDVMTPHYPDYYGDRGATPPSDDQDPNPLLFLAVRPGVKLCFAFRLDPLPRPQPRGDEDPEERERRRLLAGKTREELAGKVKTWLVYGLERLGAGAKTAAGYGYFQVPT